MTSIHGGPGGPTGPGGVLDALKSGRLQGGESRLRAAASLLEGSFYEELFKAMRETVPQQGEGANDRAMFESLLDTRVAESAAARTERGIGAALYRELARAAGADGDA